MVNGWWRVNDLNKAWTVIREIDLLLSELINTLKPYIDPIDEWMLEREAVEVIRKLSSWVEAVARKCG
jgi:hypothetical protein